MMGHALAGASDVKSHKYYCTDSTIIFELATILVTVNGL